MSAIVPSDESLPSTISAVATCSPLPPISLTTSFNFSVAKVIAIFTVTAGHWYAGTILWIPVTFGLFLFAFSSGFFTAALYGPDLDRKRFWRNKLERLGLRYWTILTFLVLLAIFQGRPVLHWHTALHFSGLSGFLNWAGMPSQSALGLGLWFFTLLLMFYLTYPFLAKFFRARTTTWISLTGGFLLACYLQESIKVGHELWLTAFGFVAGVGWGIHRATIFARPMLALTVVLLGLLVTVNLLGIKALNTWLIGAGAMALALWLASTTVARWPALSLLATLEKYVLEIFMVHQYLFIHPTGHGVADFALSLALIVIVSVTLGLLADRLAARIFNSRTRARVIMTQR